MFLNWSWPAARIVDTVRALAPAPAARALIGGEILKIAAARTARPGESGETADGGFVKTAGDGAGVAVLQLTPPNRGPMSGAAYFRSHGAA